MDCDDAMLAIANRDRTLTDKEGAQFRHHLDGCEECRAIAEDVSTDWRWIARIPADAFDSDVALTLPMVDPIVFDIDQEIATGGMGRITKAMDRRLGREVAVKEVLSENLRARFEREAMITARLQHPAIVPIYEAGTFPNGNPFYTMRLVWGGTLGAAIHKTRTIGERIALLPHVLAVIDALAYAHDNRIIHRDLKPGNVLVGEFGETVVIDWGLAKELDTKIESATADTPSKQSHAKLTRVGSVLGTPGFMSPEQASGGNLDERADVYALGAILYNLLAGVPPYWDKHGTEGSSQLISIGLAKPPTPLAQVAPDAPADLRTICERAMARRKEDRYPSAKEMATELRRFSAGQLISRAYTLRELIARWIRKHRTAVVITLIAAITLAVVAIVAFVNVSRSRRDEQEHRLKAEAAETVAQNGVASLLEEQGLRELLGGDSNRALTYLAAAFERRDSPALRYLLAVASDDLEKEHYALDPAKAIAFDGDRVVTVEALEIVFWDGKKQVRRHPLGTEQILDAQFDPTRKYVGLQRAIQSRRTRLDVFEVATGTRVWTIDDPTMDGGQIAFDREGKRTASFAGTKLHIHELGTPKPVKILDAPAKLLDVAIGTKYLAACADDGVIYVWDVTAFDREPRKLRQPDKSCLKLEFLDHHQLVIANKNYELLRWSVESAAPDRTMSGHIAINTIGVHPKGVIATGDATGIVMWTFDGVALGESRDVQGGIDKLAFSPDGKSLVGAGADDRVLVWDVESFHLRRATSAGAGSIRGIAIADGKIATVGDGSSHVWAMPGGRLVHREPSHRSVIAGDAWITATDKEVTVRQLSDGAARHRIPHAYEPTQLFPGAGVVVIAAKGGTQWVLDLQNTPPTIKPGPNHVASVTTDRRRLLAIGNKRVTIVDAASGADLRTIPLEAQPLPIGDISADGRFVAVVLPETVRVIDLETDRVVNSERLPPGHAFAPRFDPTGAHLVLYGGNEPAMIVDTSSGRAVATLPNTQSTDGLKFSRNGTHVAINIGNTVQVWTVTADRDHSAGRYLHTVGSTVQNAYALSDDGQLFATGSIDGQIRIWDETGRLLDRLVGSQTGITWLAFSNDRLLAQSEDHISTIWDVHRDTRSNAIIKTFAADHSNWKLEGVQIVPKR